MWPFDQLRLQALCEKHHKPKTCLYELLKSTEGYKFWIENGFSWSGDFSLLENSQNLHYFNEYLRERNLKLLPF